MGFRLDGIKVIETATGMAGPMAGRLLGDMGADVIHVEHPIRGDMSRDARRILASQIVAGRNIESTVNYSHENHNCNKRGMTLDLTKKSGHDIIHKMLETADIFLANYRPGELKKFDLEYSTLEKANPRLIVANVTGYGMNGPDNNLPGYDFNAFWARSGILRILCTPDMEPPTTPVALGDRVTALCFAFGIMTALFTRERSGQGQEVETSIFNVGTFVNANDIGGALVTGQDRQNAHRKDLSNVLLGSYKTQDNRWLRLAINQPDRYWSKVCKALGSEELEKDPRFINFSERINNHLALFEILEETFASKPLSEWKVRLTEAGLPWAPISTLPEVVSDPQARANNYFQKYIHPTYGAIEILANPVHFSKTESTITQPAPEFGQHTEEILLEYGYDWEQIARFKEEGVIA
jgi:crotonobetainyl-CoA:carnitine CoA-transferase CaiB-like acyl-CoA transferase